MEPLSPHPEDARRWSALLVTTLAAFLTPFMSSSVNVALPTIGRSFHADAISLSWVAMGAVLSAGVFLLPFGRLADIHGRKRIFLWGAVVYTSGSLACGLAPTLPVLIGSRVLQGTGAAMFFGTGVAMLTSVFPAEERGRVLGLNVGATYLGLSMGPFVGGFLTKNVGWEGVFLANVPVGLLVIGAVLFRLKGEWRGTSGDTFDGAGSAMYVVALCALMYGLSTVSELQGRILAAGGIGGLALFVWWEQRVRSPLLHVEFFRHNAVFAYSNLAAFINYSATFAVTFLLSLYLQYVKGFEPQQAGLILVAQPVVMTLTSPVAGRLSDRMEPRILASLGMGLTGVALVVLAFERADTPLWQTVGALVILGAGFGLFTSPNTNAVMGSVDRRYYGVASATIGTMRLTGQIFSMAIATALLALTIGHAPMSSDLAAPFLTTMRIAFLIFAAFCAFGVPASYARGNVRTS